MKSQWAFLLILLLGSTVVAQEEDASPESMLLGRTHNVRVGLGFGTTTVGEMDTTNIDADLMYRFNFGFIEPGFGLHYKSWNSEPGFPGEDVSYDFFVRGNFIKNEPGRNFIPYAQAGISIIANEDEDSMAYTTYSGQPIDFALGFQVYPFSEIFAFDISLAFNSGTYESTSDNPESSTEIDSKTTQLRVGYTLSFE